MLVAIFVGYQVPDWDRMNGFGILMAVLALMLIPFLLKWHHAWLITTWNMSAMVFFLPGRPSVTLALAAVSLLISLLHHAINQEAPFLHVRVLFWPIVFLTCVVLVTMKLTGGLGLNIAGSANVGGKRSILYLGAVMGYFALTAQRIPPEKVNRYTTLFFMGPVTNVISDISLFVAPSAVYYIFLIFPPRAASERASVPATDPRRLSGCQGLPSPAARWFTPWRRATVSGEYSMAGNSGGRRCFCCFSRSHCLADIGQP